MARHISREIKEAALKMSQQGLSDELIKQYLGVGGRTMRRLRATHHAIGDVVRIPMYPGRPRILDGLDARVRSPFLSLHCLTNFSQFLEGCIQRQPDMSLEELQTRLLEVTDIQVSTATIWRTLRRLGYTMKTVGLVLMITFCLASHSADHTPCYRTKRGGTRRIQNEHWRAL